MATRSGEQTSLQITVLSNVPEGEHSSEYAFLLKNITEDNLTVEILPLNGDIWIQTVLYPGWNVELVRGVRNVTVNTLQYGY